MGCADKSENTGVIMRGSSVHFKRIASAIHSVSHASREAKPEYLLPPEHSLGTFVVIDDKGQLVKLLAEKMSLASRQAKATKDYSPMWEGVINLPEPSDEVTPETQIQIVKDWCAKYEEMTGHKVIRADVHLDEGFMDEKTGKPQFNAHAHVMCDRTDDKGKVKKLTSTVLREVQSMTAGVTTLQRGVDARTTGRKHIGHQNFRWDAEKNRKALDGEKVKTARIQKLFQEDTPIINKLTADLAAADQLKAQYLADREALKASGQATQRAYQALKAAHELALAELKAARLEAKETKAKLDAVTKENEVLKNEITERHFRHTIAAANSVEEVTQKALDELSAKDPGQPMGKPEKTLLERLVASLDAFVAWVKGIGGQIDPVTDSSRHVGPVVQIDALHCVQKTGRSGYAIHELGKLDQIPELDNAQLAIQYRDGHGHVSGSGRTPKHR